MFNCNLSKVSLTHTACLQPSCCDEWTGYGVTLLPKSSTGDIHRVNSYRTLPRAGDPAIATDGMANVVAEGGSQVGDLSRARYYGGTSHSAVSWCGRFSVPSSTLAGCSCRLGSTGDQCDANSDLWNNGNDVDVDDYGICSSSRPPSGGHTEHPSQNDVNVRLFLSRPQTVEMTDLLGGINENMTSSRDLLVATDTVIGQHLGDHDNNNNSDHDDDDEDEDWRTKATFKADIYEVTSAFISTVVSWHGGQGQLPTLNFSLSEISSCLKIFLEKASAGGCSPSNVKTWLDWAGQKLYVSAFWNYNFSVDRSTAWVNFRLFFYTCIMRIQSESPWYFYANFAVGNVQLSAGKLQLPAPPPRTTLLSTLRAAAIQYVRQCIWVL